MKKVKSKHTPGPWTASKFAEPQWIIRGSSIVANTVGGNDEANAQLIASAPELLQIAAMFEKALVLIQCTKHLAEQIPELEATLAKTREVIKKARGE